MFFLAFAKTVSPQGSVHLSAALTSLHLSLPVWAVSTGWALALVSKTRNDSQYFYIRTLFSGSYFSDYIWVNCLPSLGKQRSSENGGRRI